MKNVLKWIGIIVGGLVLLIVVVVGGVYMAATMRMDRVYSIQPAAVTIPDRRAHV